MRRFYFFSSTALQWDLIEAYINGSNALLKYVFFMLTRPFRPWIDPRGANMIPIHLMLFKQSASRLSIHSPINRDEPNLVTERRFMLPISDVVPERGVYTEIIAGYLSTMCVPGSLHPDIIQKIYNVIEVADPGLPIDVTIEDVTVNVLGKSTVPPTKTVFHKVRPDSLESTIRQKPCAGCHESLDHFYDAEEGITRLPCLHLFHEGCLVQCLDLIDEPACPICSYPLVEFVEPSKPLVDLDWPMLLMMAASGIITVTLLCRLLKRP
ncbi:uncharacterized protein LOC133728314 [Rosa rugosa]|uniref:uncharacterized protein LOC133728314 n=1 Tax=Rosa rugosa TaxID=74645 RepID=UPI002B403F05|nr:uncharacterized protein LOC133728314 [Rosa rugosa]